MVQDWIAISIALIAGAHLAHRFLRPFFSGNRSSCGDCSGCEGESEKKLVVQLEAMKRDR